MLVDGADVLTMRWGDLRALRWARASIVFQGALHSLNPVHRIGQQIAEPIEHPRARRLPTPRWRRRVGELLEQVGLPAARAAAYPHQLSGGQRQRVMIAMALACRPDADRGRRADHRARRDGAGAGARPAQRSGARTSGWACCIISHDLSVLAELCDRIVVMYAGRVVERGRPTQVFDAPLHPYAAALSAAFPQVGDPAARFAPAGLAG